jgi:DNA repair protein SbcD/Mre11
MRQPVAVIITDTHLKEDNIGVNKLVYKQALELAKKLKVNKIFHAGDIFNSRKAQPQILLTTFDDILESFDETDVKLVAIPGNHDKVNYTSEKSFLIPFRKHPSFELHSMPTMYSNDFPKIGIGLAPFFDNEVYVDNFWFNDIKEFVRKKNVLITHIGVNGAVMNNGMPVQTKINEDLFKRFDKVLIGHYHDSQVMSDRIQYIGASIQHNYGEKPVKGATVLYDDLSTELVPFQFPQYLAFEVNAAELTLKDIKDFELTKKETGNNLRIVLTGDKASIKAIDKHRLQLAGIDVTTKEDEIKKEDIEESVVAFTDQSILGSFGEFCKKNKLDEKEGLKYLKPVLQ